MRLEVGKTYIIEIGWEATIIGTVKEVTKYKIHLKNAQVDRGLGRSVYHRVYSLDKSVISGIREW